MCIATSVCGGDFAKDYQAINEGRLEFYVNPEKAKKVIRSKEADPAIVRAAMQAAWSEQRRARHGFQVVMSFGAGADSEGFHMDGMHVGSGFEVAQYFYTWLSWFMFGSQKEGGRHIYFDWYNLRGLPGSREERRSNGTISVLNDAWKELYLEAFHEAKLLIFLVSTPWLDSPNCHEEFEWLIDSIAKNPHAKNMPLFWVLDDRVTSHVNWPVFLKRLSQIAVAIGYGPNFWNDYIFDFSTKRAQDVAVGRTIPFMKRLCSFWPLGGQEQRITDGLLQDHYKIGVKNGIPGFEPDAAGWAY